MIHTDGDPLKDLRTFLTKEQLEQLISYLEYNAYKIAEHIPHPSSGQFDAHSIHAVTGVIQYIKEN